jgi:polysaccharide deacetylase 2 family uncharacterized protein YibQ
MLLALLALLVAGPAVATPRIAIIIDDVGNRLVEGRRAVALPGPVALAFLPHTPNAQALAEAAHNAGKEVLLHLPLQALEDRDPGPGALLLDTTEPAFRRIVQENLAAIPHVQGVNTHMGSLLTRHPGHMAWLMEELHAVGGLFFVDSYTAAESVALQLAREAGIPAVRRHVFLDAEISHEGVRLQFARLVAHAQEHGYAVGIGHPFVETMDVLEDVLARLDEFGVELVPVSTLVE